MKKDWFDGVDNERVDISMSLSDFHHYNQTGPNKQGDGSRIVMNPKEFFDIGEVSAKKADSLGLLHSSFNSSKNMNAKRKLDEENGKEKEKEVADEDAVVEKEEDWKEKLKHEFNIDIDDIADGDHDWDLFEYDNNFYNDKSVQHKDTIQGEYIYYYFIFFYCMIVIY